MPDVELVMTVIDKQLIEAMRRDQKAADDLQTSMKNLNQEIRKVSVHDIEGKYKLQGQWRKEKESLDEVNKRLEGYNKKTEEVDNSNENLSKSVGNSVKSLGKMAGIISLVTVGIRALSNAFKETVGGIKLFNQVGTIAKTILNGLVTQGKINLANIVLAVKAQKQLTEIQLNAAKQSAAIAKLQGDYDTIIEKSTDATLSYTEKLQLHDKAVVKHNELLDKQIETAKKERDSLAELAASSLDNTVALGKYYTKAAEVEQLESQRTVSELQNSQKRTAILKEELDTRDELLDKYSGTAINKLFGIDKISDERDWALKELRDYQTALIGKLGSLTPEQQKMIQEMADEIWLVALKEMNQTGRADTGNLKSRFGNWADILFPDMKKIKTDIQEYGGTLAKDKSTFWDVLGIDPESEQGQKVIDNLKVFAENIKGILTSITDRMVEDAQRRRELLDQQITETQNALELEAGLMEEGYANNLTAKRKELEQLKKQRAEALADEEKALKIQRQIDTAMQVSSLITATAEILKGWSKIPLIGHILAIAAIAAMFTAFGIAKVKAASLTKLAEGGTGTDTGIITGKSHAAGGEHFLSHVEVERGERWGVLNKKASEKFGKTFNHIVSSFNKDQMPTFGTPEYSNSVMVNNDGSNSRLDKVIAEQKKLNNQFGKDQILITGHRKVVTKGKNIRIVG